MKGTIERTSGLTIAATGGAMLESVLASESMGDR
jgi:hypothetical protein